MKHYLDDDDLLYIRQMCGSKYGNAADEKLFNKTLDLITREIKLVKKINRRNARMWYNDKIKGRRCGWCEFSDHRALLFHHTNPKNKIDGVCNMVKDGYSIDMLEAECDKCELICHNCHAIFHWGRGFRRSP